ncbi:MAG TPA: peptide deformylase, partial [Nitrososphaeraceae archaeon]
MIAPNNELNPFELAKSLQFYGSIVLRIPSKPIEKITKDTKILIKEMFQIMKAFGASGLAANQVGI